MKSFLKKSGAILFIIAIFCAGYFGRSFDVYFCKKIIGLEEFDLIIEETILESND
tara:strand:- start:45917 stop:46081 length:165 start_codon:yes stop_codon:yes gene_type:complete